MLARAALDRFVGAAPLFQRTSRRSSSESCRPLEAAHKVLQVSRSSAVPSEVSHREACLRTGYASCRAGVTATAPTHCMTPAQSARPDWPTPLGDLQDPPLPAEPTSVANALANALVACCVCLRKRLEGPLGLGWTKSRHAWQQALDPWSGLDRCGLAWIGPKATQSPKSQCLRLPLLMFKIACFYLRCFPVNFACKR